MMARHNSLVLGPAASGTIGDQLTFSQWKGIPVCKTKPIPSNPNSAGQQLVRANWTALITEWHHADRTGADKVAFNVLAGRDSRALSGFNEFVSKYRDIYTLGSVGTFIRNGSAIRAVLNLTVAGKGSANKNIKITVVNDKFTYLTQDTDAIAAGVFSKVVVLPAGTTKGYAIVECTDAGFEGISGYYYFS
jgi:hypothetical protein